MGKKKKSYLSIPDDFSGFGYKEVKVRRAVLEVTRDQLRQRMSMKIDGIGNTVSSVGKAVGDVKAVSSIGDKISEFSKSKKKFDTTLRICGVGYEVFKLFRRFRKKVNTVKDE